MPYFCFAVTLRQIQNTLEDKESHDETKKLLERCPLRVEELNQPGHLLIEVSNGTGMLHAIVFKASSRRPGGEPTPRNPRCLAHVGAV
jgi:hypothetical protein